MNPLQPPLDTAVVLAAHGERGGARNNAALLSLAGALLRSGRYRAVAAGVLSGEPSLEQAVEGGRRVATAKGLAHGLGCPIVGVPTGAALLAVVPEASALLLPAGPSDRVLVRAASE